MNTPIIPLNVGSNMENATKNAPTFLMSSNL
jgi:hypothetical protein